MGIETVDRRDASGLNDLGLTLAAQETLRRRDRAISQGRCAVGDDRVPRPEACAVQLGRGPGLEESSTRSRQGSTAKPSPSIRILRPLTTVLASRWRVRSASTTRSSNIARPLRCGRRPGPSTGSLRCATGPSALALEEALRGVGKEVRRSHRRRSEFMRSLTTVLASRWQARSASTPRSSNIARPLRCGRSTGSPDRKFALRNWAEALRLEEPLRGGGKEVRRSHRRRSEFCARL